MLAQLDLLRHWGSETARCESGVIALNPTAITTVPTQEQSDNPGVKVEGPSRVVTTVTELQVSVDGVVAGCVTVSYSFTVQLDY